MATFVNSQRGHQKLVHLGFVYQCRKDGNKGQRYWSCEQRRDKCPGCATTDGENNVTVTRQHNHPPSQAQAELAIIKSQIREVAVNSTTKPRALVKEQLALVNVSEQTKALLPNIEALEKIVSRKRRRAEGNETTAAGEMVGTTAASEMGHQKLVHSGFLYRRKKEGQNGKRYWLCDLDKKEKCNGAAITDAENNVTVTRPHNHPPSPARSELAQIKNQIKQIAASSNVKARTLITEQLALAGVSEQVKASLPKFSSLEKMVSRKRCAANDGTNNNTSAADDNLWNNEFTLNKMEAPQVVKTQLGNNKLVFQNYLFIFDKYVESGSQKAWRCDNKNKGCKARVWTDLLDNVLTELEKNQHVEHNHEIANVLSQHFKMEAKKRARQTNAPPTQIRNELMAELPGIQLTSFIPPTKNAIRQVIKRARESRKEQHDFEFDSPEMVSAIWTCFSKTETRGEAQCHYCSRILIQHQGSTKILWSHLKSNHKPEFAQLKQNQQVLVPSTSKAAANQSNNVDLNQFFAQNENPKMEVIKVKSTPKANNNKRAKLSGNNYGGDFPSRGSSEVSSQADGPSTIPAVSHILVWSALSHEQNNPTYIMANLMDDGDDPLHSGYGELSISSVIHQKLGAVTEPSGCCFSTRMPANIVLNEFSNLGYRAIGMVNKRTDEVLWTLAKNN